MNSVPNTPYVHAEHFSLLKAVAPGLRSDTANAFGDCATNANWHCMYMPYASALAFDAKCLELGIYAANDPGSYPGTSCRKLCKYVRDLY